MFRPSLPSFADIAADLYGADAFRALPTTAPVTAAPAEQDLVYEGPLDRRHDAFAAFRASGLLARTQAQFLERIAQCRAFAQAHCSAAEARGVAAGLDAFEDHLLHQQGDAYFHDKLPLLYSVGKRDFDTFCQRLVRPDIDLHQRRTALRELSDQLRACRAAGPAFTEAAHRLESRPGGLHGEFLDALSGLTDALLLQFVYANRRGMVTEPWLRDMESHVVNRLKLELRLPGADANDHFSLGDRLLLSDEAQACARMLRRELRPATVALALAQRYRELLLTSLSERLNLPPTAIDPGLHMPEVLRESARLGATYAGISLHSLLEHDVADGSARWRTDLSLVALDLMRELTRLGLVQPQDSCCLLKGRTADSQWWLRHTDWRLFHVEERIDGTQTSDIDNVRLRHYLLWRPHGAEGLARRGVTSSVLSAEDPDALMTFPAKWLDQPAHADHLLQRLGPRRSVAWLAHQALDARALGLLLVAATHAGHTELLDRLLTLAPVRPAGELVELAGGPCILAAAVAQGDPAIVLPWQARLLAMLPDMSAAMVARGVTAIDGRRLVAAVLTTGNTALLQPLLTLLMAARAQGRLTDAAFQRHLQAPMQKILLRGHHAALDMFGDHLTQAASAGWIPHDPLQRLLEGSRAGAGCFGALAAGHVACIRWFHGLVIRLARQGLLQPHQAAIMLARHLAAGISGGAPAIRYHQPEALDAFLSLAVDATEQGWIPAAWLPKVLGSLADNGAPGISIMTLRAGDRCRAPWRDAVLGAFDRGLLPPATVARLMQAFSAEGIPLARAMPRNDPLATDLLPWLATLRALHERGALSRREIRLLLEARGPGHLSDNTMALHEALGTWLRPLSVRVYVNLYCQAYRERLIRKPTLEHLLGANDNATGAGEVGVSGLVLAICRHRHGAVRCYLQALIDQARQHALPGDTLARLLDGRGRNRCTALAAAGLAQPPQLLEALLATMLEAARDTLITPAQWVALLEPDGGAVSIFDALGRRADATRVQTVLTTLQVAAGLRLITRDEHLRLRQRLDLVGLQLEGRVARAPDPVPPTRQAQRRMRAPGWRQAWQWLFRPRR